MGGATPIMSLSYDRFLTDISRFVQLSDNLRDGWTLREMDGIKFLCKKTFMEHEDASMSCDYHVIHNSSYSVPILYFSVTSEKGKRLSLEEIWPSLPSSTRTQNKWSMITDTDHPLLTTPYFHIHPCHTSTLMTSSCLDTSFYLLTWLSSLGPLVGIKLSLHYYQ